MIKFSIAIPAYKRRFLKEAIESCLAQTYGEFELVIVDDASPEDIGSVVKSFDDAAFSCSEFGIPGRHEVFEKEFQMIL